MGTVAPPPSSRYANIVELEVLQSLVGLDGEEFTGGVHDIPKPSARLLKAAAAAEAVGAVKVRASEDERARMAKHLESQAASEKAYAKAQADGTWHVGNVAQFLLEKRQLLEHGDLNATERASLEAQVAEVAGVQDHMQAGLSYQDAVARVKGQ